MSQAVEDAAPWYLLVDHHPSIRLPIDALRTLIAQGRVAEVGAGSAGDVLASRHARSPPFVLEGAARLEGAAVDDSAAPAADDAVVAVASRLHGAGAHCAAHPLTPRQVRLQQWLQWRLQQVHNQRYRRVEFRRGVEVGIPWRATPSRIPAFLETVEFYVRSGFWTNWADVKSQPFNLAAVRNHLVRNVMKEPVMDTDFLVAPTGPVFLPEYRVTTHRFMVSVPLGR